MGASIGAQLKARHLPHTFHSFAVNSPTFSVGDVVTWALEGSGSETGLCFGAFVWAESQPQAVLHELRANGFRGAIVLGGPQVSGLPKVLLMWRQWCGEGGEGASHHL